MEERGSLACAVRSSPARTRVLCPCVRICLFAFLVGSGDETARVSPLSPRHRVTTCAKHLLAHEPLAGAALAPTRKPLLSVRNSKFSSFPP